MLYSSGQKWQRAVGGILGGAFLLVGLIDQTLTLIPMAWGDASWEVAYAGQMSATFGLPMLGIGFLGTVMLFGRPGWTTGLLGVAVAMAGAFVTFAGLVALTDLPLVWQAAGITGSAVQATGFKIVAVKGVVLSGIYAFGLFWMAGILVRSTIQGRA